MHDGSVHEVIIDQCKHCSQAKDVHGDEGKCLFEASFYEPQKLDVGVFTMTWEIVPQKKRPYPEPSEASWRKERRLKEKAYKPPR